MQDALPETGAPNPMGRRLAWKRERAPLSLGRRLLLEYLVLLVLNNILLLILFAIYLIRIFTFLVIIIDKID